MHMVVMNASVCDHHTVNATLPHNRPVKLCLWRHKQPYLCIAYSLCTKYRTAMLFFNA